MRVAKRSRTPVTAPVFAPGDDKQLSRRTLLTRALGTARW
jgi:hypothetical protein